MPYTLAQAPEMGGRGTPDIIHMPGPFGHLYNGKGESVKDSSGKAVQVRFGKDGGVRLPASITTTHSGSGGLYMLIPIQPSAMARDPQEQAQTQGFNPDMMPHGSELGMGGSAQGLQEGGMQTDYQAQPIEVAGAAPGADPNAMQETDPQQTNTNAQTSMARVMRPGRQ
jgi:hypothetical protein